MKAVFLFSVIYIILLSSITLQVSLKGNISTRVIGGHNAISGQFPFVAAIEVTTSNGKYFCGGTLINNEWIVTAAQCVYDGQLFSIRLGSATLTNTDSNRVTVSTSSYVIHPDYDPQTLSNDIGLIQLRMPIEFTDYISSVGSLPEEELEESSKVVVVGWGQTSDDDSQLSENLKFISVVTLSNQECQTTYGSQIIDTMVCVEGNYNEGACHGDTGSPLVVVPSTGSSQLVGISSFVSGNGCESTDPSGYTRVFPYVEWIKNATNMF